ncbi:MAG: phosphopantetheine-binding protein [Kiloniellales bacterium]
MSQPTDLRPRLCAFIAETHANGREIGEETELVRSGIVESYGIVDLLLFIEEEYGIAIPDEMLTPDNFRTVADIARCVDAVRDAEPDDG